ncbi:MAG: polysaccharide deacetylase family protein [Helicobacteraceae bacterium]|jgi:peptidoglycan/xylan/chitin deacetylase (PgdA/CDA1 family)|nr:polysaccharide deacetylase family protein [Helicobacteraceae bacterium]
MLRFTAIICLVALNCAAVLPPALIERGDDNLTFNEASKIEILSFAKTVLSQPPLTIELLAQKTDLKAARINLESVKRVRARILNDLLVNYYAAIGFEGKAIARENAEAKLGNLTRSYAVDPKRERFYESYFYELIRLAALFPKTSSEIDRFNDRELLGGELGDREFCLTFDDGPSEAGGTTDSLIAALNDRNLSAIFFALGENAAKREADLDALYGGHRLASHGWRHISHADTALAKASISQADKLLSASGAYVKAFRPPYGQRAADLGAFLSDQNISLVLWNIDSQDWQSAVSAQAAADRVLTLALVWRKGIILFHDTHTKAEKALPTLTAKAKALGVTFDGCPALFR